MGILGKLFGKKKKIDESDVSGIEIRKDLPKFKYYFDPLKSRSFIMD